MASGLFGSFTIPTSQRTCQLDCRVWTHPASPGVHRYTQLPFVLVVGKNRTVAPLVPEEQGRGSRLQIAQSQGRHPDAGDRSHLLVVGPCQSVLCRTSRIRHRACPGCLHPLVLRCWSLDAADSSVLCVGPQSGIRNAGLKKSIHRVLDAIWILEMKLTITVNSCFLTCYVIDGESVGQN